MRFWPMLALAAAACSKTEEKPAPPAKVEARATAAPSAVPTAVDAPPAESHALALSSVKAELERAPNGTAYVRVGFDATAREPVAKHDQIAVRIACQMDKKRIVDRSYALGLVPSDLQTGETRSAEVSAWAGELLERAPTSCDVAFFLSPMMRGKDRAIAEYCFTPPRTTKPGACPGIAAQAEMQAGPVATIDDVRPEVGDAPDGDGKKTVRVTFDTTLRRKLAGRDVIAVRFACDVAGKRVVERTNPLESDLSRLAPGETERATATAWTLRPLDGSPTACDLGFALAPVFGDDETKLADFCFVPPRTVIEGACAK